MTEEEVRNKLEQNSIVMRRLSHQRREVDEQWNEVMAETIQLRHQLDLFAIERVR